MSRMRLLLASRSPQRRAILEQLGIEFEVVVPEVEELTTGQPEALVVENARRKAVAGVAVAAGTPPGGPTLAAMWPPKSPLEGSNSKRTPVLGVDTVVALGDAVYGKPADRDEAESTLRVLSGAVHRVVSGICLVDDPAVGARTALATTMVSFRPIDEPTLAWYLDTGEWRERAGGYAIQGRGAALVASIEGDYLNVVGLPAATLLELEPRLLARR
jgi:septum formation protein